MKNSIGIDIGGTITKIGIVSSEGKCLKKISLPVFLPAVSYRSNQVKCSIKSLPIPY